MKDKINILGTEYTISFGTTKEYPALEKMDGYTDTSVHLIVIDNMSELKEAVDRKKDLESYKNCVLRHEIVHAFLYESGLSSCSKHSCNWAVDEEMVDWFSIQSPKIYKVFDELDIL